jgi:hypothetical protein
MATSGIIRLFLMGLITHRNACAEINDRLENVPAELGRGLHLAEIKYVKAMFASIEFVEVF